MKDSMIYHLNSKKTIVYLKNYSEIVVLLEKQWLSLETILMLLEDL